MSEVCIDEVIPRHQEENPYNYTNLEKAERSKAIKDMMKDYPHLPPAWIDMVYDYWKQTPEEEVNEIINSGKWEGKGMFSKAKGGVINCMTVEDPVVDLKDRYIGVYGLDGEADPPDPSGNQ